MIVTKEGKLLKPNGDYYKTYINNSGYECIKYHGKHYLVHRLVAESLLLLHIKMVQLKNMSQLKKQHLIMGVHQTKLYLYIKAKELIQKD